MAANMYRVGDYVYFETSSTTPYQIRRIEELNKTPNGNVEAKVMCFYRRRDISSSLIMLADKHQSGSFSHLQGGIDGDSEDGGSENGDASSEKSSSKPASKDYPPGSKEDLEEKEKHQLKHRELFLSRQVETLPATHIRGKCAVTLLNETESLLSYLNKDDAFFYSLVYDPQQKTLLADKGEIRVGSRFQAEATPRLKEGETDGRDLSNLEQLVWSPDRSVTTDKQIDQFLVIARSVGTFARALDCTSTVRQPSLHMSAAAASRDITLFHAMDTLHKHTYDVSKAISSLVPSSGPVLCRDEMEEWSASEANLFEEALDKYGKDFNDIRQDFLPWKSLKSIVEYYYMWKTTDRYVQQKRIKAAEAESKLKQVYIPNYNKPNPAQINDVTNLDNRGCESCYTTQSGQWYAWGPTHMQCRLCALCWIYWKKYGGLKMPTRLDGTRPNPEQRTERLAQMAALQRMHRCTIGGCGKEFRLKAHLARHLATAHGLAIRAGSPRPVMKTRAAFCLITTPLTRISRQVCRDILQIQRSARQPFQPINIALIKQECSNRLMEKKPMRLLVKRPRRTMNACSAKMGIDISYHPKELEHTAVIKEPAVYAFPKGPVPPFLRQTEASATAPTPPTQPSILGKRGFDQSGSSSGGDSSSQVKRPSMGVIRQAGNAKQMEGKHQRKVSSASSAARGSVINQANGGGGGGRMGRIPVQRAISTAAPGAKKLSWMEAPDDVFFAATDNTRKLRKALSASDFKRAARKPWRNLKGVKVLGSGSSEGVVVLD